VEADTTRAAKSTSPRFHGREDSFEQLAELVEEAWLVGIHGPPGVGKSRLGAEFAERCRWPAIHCGLGEVETHDEFLRVVAASLGTDLIASEAPEELSRRIRLALAEGPDRLLVLDDADRVPELERWLERCSEGTSHVRVLLTTRARRHISQGVTLDLEGLDVDAGCALFVEHARALRPSFEPTATMQQDIERLVEALDGLPLAIEMAASRMSVMSPGALLARLGERLDVVRSRSRGAGARSLREDFEWSWELLDEDARRCLARCSVLARSQRRGFTLQAAEAVCEGVVDPFEVVDVLESLVADAWLESRLTPGGRVRFEMINVVRQFATDKLGEHPEDMRAAQGQAAGHFLELAKTHGPEVSGPRGPEAFEAIERAWPGLLDAASFWLDNEPSKAVVIIEAIHWNAVMHGPLQAYVDLAQTLYDKVRHDDPGHADVVGACLADALFLVGEHHLAEQVARRHFESPGHEPSQRARLARTLSMIVAQRDTDEALELLRQARGSAQECQDSFSMARAVERMGYVHTQRNEIDEALMHFLDARELFERASNPLFTADVSTGIGYVELRRGDAERARLEFGRAVETHRSTGNRLHRGSALFNLGVCEHEFGRPDEAERALAEAVEIWTTCGFERFRPAGLLRLAMVRQEIGAAEALETLRQAIRLAGRFDDHHNAAIAEIVLAIERYADGSPLDGDRLEGVMAGISIGSDPDAYAAGLVLTTAVAASAGEPSLRLVNQLEEIRALLGSADEHLQGVLGALAHQGWAFHHLGIARRLADEAGDAAERKRAATSAFEHTRAALGGDPNEVDTSGLANPWVRRWAQLVLAEGKRVDGFMSQAEAFDTLLEVDADAKWYRVDEGDTVDLTTRRPLRLIMRTLVDDRQNGGEGLDVDAIFSAGWPGEDLGLSTRRNRVYTAIRMLRELDLEGVLVTGSDGYRLADDVVVRVR
jgi:tetratricopeptide (TPR) repeat protein